MVADYRSWQLLSANERLAVRDARFVRVRGRHDVLRHRRPGEFSIPGIKFSVAVGLVVGAALRLAGVGALWRNVLLVGTATFLVPWAVVLAVGLVFTLLSRLFGRGSPPPAPPFGGAGVRVPR